MSEIVAPTTAPTQPRRAKTDVLLFFARRIGAAIFQWDRRDAGADLAKVDLLIQDEYARIGLVIARQNDPAELRPALYAGADALIHTGLDSLTPKQRAQAVALFTRGLQAMRNHLAGTSNPDHVDLMKALVNADTAAGIDQVRVVTPGPAVDLSTISTSPEVH